MYSPDPVKVLWQIPRRGFTVKAQGWRSNASDQPCRGCTGRQSESCGRVEPPQGSRTLGLSPRVGRLARPTLGFEGETLSAQPVQRVTRPFAFEDHGVVLLTVEIAENSVGELAVHFQVAFPADGVAIIAGRVCSRAVPRRNPPGSPGASTAVDAETTEKNGESSARNAQSGTA